MQIIFIFYFMIASALAVPPINSSPFESPSSLKGFEDYGSFGFGPGGNLTFQYSVGLDSFSVQEMLGRTGKYEQFLDWYLKTNHEYAGQNKNVAIALTGPEGPNGRRWYKSTGLWTTLAATWFTVGYLVNRVDFFSLENLPVVGPPLLVAIVLTARHEWERRIYARAKDDFRYILDNLEFHSFALTQLQTRAWKRGIFQYDVLESLLFDAFQNSRYSSELTLERLKVILARFPLAPLGLLLRYHQEDHFTPGFQDALTRDFQAHPDMWDQWFEISKGEIQALPEGLQTELRTIQKQVASPGFFKIFKIPYYRARQSISHICELYLRRGD